jgi:hypothetical protein
MKVDTNEREGWVNIRLSLDEADWLVVALGVANQTAMIVPISDLIEDLKDEIER